MTETFGRQLSEARLDPEEQRAIEEAIGLSARYILDYSQGDEEQERELEVLRSACRKLGIPLEKIPDLGPGDTKKP